MSVELTKQRVRFPVTVNERRMERLISDYTNKAQSSIFIFDDLGYGLVDSFWFQTDASGWTEYVDKSEESQSDECWIWAKHIDGFLWPADGPVDRQFAVSKFYRKVN